ncbi:MAG TPA: penicillin-binding transpeptidase domain-containing protein [Clostridia bacterium]|nr:penicillin-binding transpeptidase domain-containing protein [Clostridia bacterium]
MRCAQHWSSELIVLTLCTLLSAVCWGGEATGRASLSTELRRAFGDQKGAAVVIRVRDSQILAAHNIPVLTRRVATPGSSMKPFTLQFLIDNKLLKGTDRIACRRSLTISGIRLNCSHPAPHGAFDAQEALAFSCNSYFAEAAKRLPRLRFEQYLRGLGFDRTTGLLPGEAEGHVPAARTIQERQLLAIGAAGIEITPLELAAAYMRLARRQKAPTESERVVLNGLAAATDYGLAQGARPGSLKIAGKTGTAADPGGAVTHAWFAGFAPADSPQVVVVVFVERGRGSVEAANVARRILKAWEGTAQ